MTEASQMSLSAAVRDLGLTGATPVGSGMEFEVWRARHPRWGEVALRVPARPVDSNDNDPHVETAELIRHEEAVYRHLRPLGLPVPRLFDLRHYEVDVLVCEYVAADGSSCGSFELGEVIAQLHAAPVSTEIAPARAAPAFRETVAERVARRWSVLHASHPDVPPAPAAGTLAAAIPDDVAVSLLHLDVRASNVITRGGRVSALVDWTNSRVGDPALELARAEENTRFPENSLNHHEFLSGYTSVRPLPDRSAECWALYRLDAAIMLALVFTSEAPDPERGPEMVRRTQELIDHWRSVAKRPGTRSASPSTGSASPWRP